MESYADINPFDIKPGNSSQNPPKNGNGENDLPKVKFNPEEFFYDMSGERHLVIFNYEKYDETSIHYYRDPPKPRKYSDGDVTKLEDTFKQIGFTVDTYDNKTREFTWDKLCEIRKTDYSAASCLCIAILTHGAENGELCAYDRTYKLSEVTKLFENHPTLAGKPKLFFIQACRGTKKDAGNTIDTDGEDKGKIFVIPSHADFLVMRSTVEDYLSYRDCRGSWLIQELCKAILEYRQYLDILQIATIVQKKVAYGYATYTPKNKDMHNKRQMPETTTTLTKFLKF